MSFKLRKIAIVGAGTTIDSARLKNILSGYLGEIDPKSIQAYSMGEHGDSQMVPWSNVNVAGKPFLKLIEENEKLKSEVDLDEIVEKTSKAGWEIHSRKGTTYYGIAAAVVGIIKAIFADEKRILPISALLEGEYGEKNVYTGVPTIVGKSGAEKAIEIYITEEEKLKFKKSNDTLRTYIKGIGY